MPRLARSYRLAAIVCLLTTTLSLPGNAQEKLFCGLVNQPAATVLLPYFEVDLENPAGRTTLFSVGNSADDATLGHGVLWTNWGHPVLSFDFFLPAGGVQSFNVRELIQGHFPRTLPPASLPEGLYGSCTAPLALPVVDAEALTGLLTGGPHPEDGLCYSSAVEGGRLATGYITVDVVQDCSGATLATPNDDEYLGDCASGLASNDNVLWGDFFLVDPVSDYAQGEKLVPLIADQVRFGADECVDPPCGIRIGETFYSPGGNRMPLARAYESRFLRGGGFEGGTDLVVWVDGNVGPMVCDDVPWESSVVTANFRNEAGEVLGSHRLDFLGQTYRVSVGDDRLPVDARFGCVELSARSSYGSPRQLWVMPLLSGDERYSVGLNTVPVADFCPW